MTDMPVTVLQDAGGLALMWAGLLVVLTGGFHLLIVFTPTERDRMRRLFTSPEVWFLRLLHGELRPCRTLFLLVLTVVPAGMFSEALMAWSFVRTGAGLQCLLMLYAGISLHNMARSTGSGESGIRLLSALLLSLLVMRAGWLLMLPELAGQALFRG